MTIVHLVRHGETQWNREGRLQGHRNSPLTSLGEEQATEVATKLSNYSFDAVYCSSSGRAKDTALRIVKNKKLILTYLDELREIGLGCWEGMRQSDMDVEQQEHYSDFWHQPHRYSPPHGGESFQDFSTRVMSIFFSITGAHPKGEILLVTHQVFIKMVLTRLNKLPLEKLWSPPLLENCAHRVLRLEEGGNWKIKT